MPVEWYPVGSVLPFGGGTVPAGWLLCDGQAVSRTGRADLFAIISTAFGVGDGSTTFNLPDLRARFPRGTTITTPGTSGGNANHTHATQNHTHTAVQPSDHGTHASDGGHIHDSHTAANRTAGISTFISGPVTHSSDAGHTHDAHPAHSGFAVNSGGAGTTAGNNPPFLGFDYIIASFNTFLVTVNIRQDHVVTHSPRVRLAHNVRHDHVVSFARKLTAFRTFNIRQDHTVSHRPRPRITHAVRQDHVVAQARSLILSRTFTIRQNHTVTQPLRVRLSHDVRQDHVVTFTRSLQAFRTFNVRQDHGVSLSRSLELFRSFDVRQVHTLSVSTIKTFVRTFNVRQNHLVFARICLDIDDLPTPEGGETIIKRPIYLFDD